MKCKEFKYEVIVFFFALCLSPTLSLSLKKGLGKNIGLHLLSLKYPYDLDLSKPIDPEAYHYVENDISIFPSPGKDRTATKPIAYEFKRPTSHNFMSEVNSILEDYEKDLENAPEDKRKFIYEAISRLEQWKGRKIRGLVKPVLSKHEIDNWKQEELNRISMLPLSVQALFTAVFHDKEITLKGINHVNPSLFHECQEWMATVNDKSKSPFSIAKTTTAHDWVTTDPNQPNIMIDRIIRALPPFLQIYPKFSILEEEFRGYTQQNELPPFAEVANYAKTPSMRIWDTLREDLIHSEISPSFSISLSDLKRNNSSDMQNNQDSETKKLFTIDDTEMYIPNQANDEFYIIL